MKPKIEKLGTIDCDLVETTPIVHKEGLYRFEYVRIGYSGNNTGDSYFRFIDDETGEPGPAFAKGYHMGNVFVEQDTLYVTATNIWDGERVDIFASTDMENWACWNALNLAGYGIFNTSMCRGADDYVLMFEVGKPPEVAGKRFTARFATSPDLRQWELTAPECTYSKDRYTAPHALRYLDGYYYNFYLESIEGGWDQRVVRSPDLVNWEASPLNPVLVASDTDRQIAADHLTAAQCERIAKADNCNNSDIDFCEYQGKLIINYSWGNQHGVEHLAEGIYHGTEAEFLKGWYPE
ncbi:MAG: hypothetical protein HOM68_06975 [Gemmatimonadetes bacterium]|nr:hypothetical protein [Gemmatimonadota bacterium]MBT5056264.1 hypothetical protein [Gemmatimonadota bacterium]MBT5144723.1 hypothetical protein [Gemmatimonadota bacterium]MBT5589582.1 hypothetical protein [Gemmatimonadota bacterium]MBT5963334.1 hypothetical protein [Gemmatimonadota bacterium]